MDAIQVLFPHRGTRVSNKWAFEVLESVMVVVIVVACAADDTSVGFKKLGGGGQATTVTTPSGQVHRIQTCFGHPRTSDPSQPPRSQQTTCINIIINGSSGITQLYLYEVG